MASQTRLLAALTWSTSKRGLHGLVSAHAIIQNRAVQMVDTLDEESGVERLSFASLKTTGVVLGMVISATPLAALQGA